MFSQRGPWLALALMSATPACGPAMPRSSDVQRPSMEPDQATTAPIAEATASPVTFERIASFPPPGWQIPRQVRVSPSGNWVTYLQSESSSDQMALWSLDRKTGKHSVLLRASDLVDTDKPMSRAEELRRERQRKRIKGVTGYAWANETDVMLLPLGGNVYVRTADAKIKQLTDTDAPEIDPQLCADGSKVAYVRGSELFVADVAQGKEKQLTTGAPDGVTRGLSDFNGQEEFGEAHGLWWSPSCDRLAYLEVDERKVGRIPVMGYRDGADLQHHRYPRAGTINPSSRLAVVDINNGKTIWIDMPASKTWDAGDQYLGRVMWSRDGKTLFFQRMTRDQKHLALVRADVATGSTKHLVEEHDHSWLDFSDARPLDGGGLLWTALRDGHRHIEHRDDSSGTVIAQLTSGSWDVMRIVAVDDKSKRVLFIGNKDATLDRQLYATSYDGKGDIERLTDEPGVHDVAATKVGRGWIDIHSAHDRPPKAMVRGGGLAAQEIPVPRDDDFDTLKIRPPEIVEIPGETKLYGALLKPRDMKPGVRYPLIVMVYGGPGVQTVYNRWDPKLLWQHLADRGFVIWQVDNRGSTGRGHAFESPISERLGEIELEDQLRGLDHIAAMPFVDGDRVGIYGHSYGGYMVLMAMFRAAGRFKVGVSGSPVTDWRLYDTGYTERYMGTPQNNERGYTSTSVLPDVNGLTGKLMIIHALMDENVHFEHTAKLIDTLTAADKDFELLVFPGERHGYRSPQARRYAYRRVVDYFADNL